MSKPNLLIIFVKYPQEGAVKTRLQSHFCANQVIEIYDAMVKDLLSHFTKVSQFDVHILFWPPQARQKMQRWLGVNWSFLPQTSGDLGHKMKQAFAMSFINSYKKVIIIGSDLPTLEQTDIIEAFARLENHHAVFGPSKDGGYYLIGLQTPQPNLFQNIQWSTDQVLEQTIRNAKNQGISYALLEEKKDVDEYADLIELWKEINQNKGNNPLPETNKILKKVFNKRQNKPSLFAAD